MANFFSEYKKPAVSAVVFFVTLVGISSAYAAFSALTNVVSGGQLKAVDWNAMIADLNDLNGRTVPQGAVIAFFWTSCPANWSPADGTANGVKKTDGTSGTLDLRGEFVRGLDGGRGIDPSRVLGSFQHSTVINHLAWYGGDIWLENPDYLYQSISRSKYENGNTASYTRNEYGLRPRNVALLYCVKN